MAKSETAAREELPAATSPAIPLPVPTSPATIISRFNGQKFRTIQNFGPFRKSDGLIGGKPNVFGVDEFRRLHPFPLDASGSPVKNAGIDPATYHDKLLDRGLRLGLIVSDPLAEETPTPLGPMNSFGGELDVIGTDLHRTLEQQQVARLVAEKANERPAGTEAGQVDRVVKQGGVL